MATSVKHGFVFVVTWKGWFKKKPSHIFVEAPNVDWARGKVRHWLDTSKLLIEYDSMETDGQRMEVLE